MTCQNCDNDALHHVWKDGELLRLCGECFARE